MELPTIQNVSCDGCGACCWEMTQPPYIFATGFDDEARVPAALLKEIAHFNRYVRDTLPDETPCIWLDRETLRCRHYEHRPYVCRDFEMGSPHCLEFRDRIGPRGDA